MVWVKSVVALQLVVLFLVSNSYSAKCADHPEILTTPPPQQGIHPSPPPPPQGIHPSLPPPPSVFRPPIHPSLPSPPSVFRPPIGHPPPKIHVKVEGVVFCKSCKLAGYDKTLDASPLPGAIAKLRCRRGRTVTATTDSKGYFLIDAPSVTNTVIRACHMSVWSPLPWCNKPVDFGQPAQLRFERFLWGGAHTYALYSAGFFEFAPVDKAKCPRF